MIEELLIEQNYGIYEGADRKDRQFLRNRDRRLEERHRQCENWHRTGFTYEECAADQQEKIYVFAETDIIIVNITAELKMENIKNK